MNLYTCSKVVVGLVPRLALGSDQKDTVDKFENSVKCRQDSHTELCGLLCKWYLYSKKKCFITVIHITMDRKI